MPTWLKVVVAGIAVLALLFIVAGLMVVKAVEAGKRAAEEASVEGEEYGARGSLEGCLQEGVRRFATCDSVKIRCSFVIDTFLWSCLESAPYDSRFCAEIPEAGNDAAVTQWATKVCARHGSANDDWCSFNLSVVPAFCASR